MLWISNLPPEMGLLVFEYLDHWSLCQVAIVRKEWGRLVLHDDALWHRLYLDRWQRGFRLEKHLVSSFRTWSARFQERHLVDRNWQTGRAIVTTLSGHTGTITCLHFDETKLISGSDDGSMTLWSLAPRRNAYLDERRHTPVRNHHRQQRMVEKLHSFYGHGGPVWCLKFLDNMLISGS